MLIRLIASTNFIIMLLLITIEIDMLGAVNQYAEYNLLQWLILYSIIKFHITILYALLIFI